MCKKRRKGRIDFKPWNVFVGWSIFRFFFFFYRKFSFLVKKFCIYARRGIWFGNIEFSFGKELFNGVERRRRKCTERGSIFLMVLRYWMYDVYVNKSILRCLYKFCGDWRKNIRWFVVNFLNLSIIALFNIWMQNTIIRCL